MNTAHSAKCQVYHCSLETLTENEKEWFWQLAGQLHRKVPLAGLSYQRKEDQLLSCFAEMALRLCLSEREHALFETPFQRNESGKPSLNCPIHFSISHSYPYVSFGINQKMIGVDIETLKPAVFNPPRDWADFFQEQELSATGLPFPCNHFFLWAAKESWVKMHGKGIDELLNQAVWSPIISSVDGEGKKWQGKIENSFVATQKMEGCFLSVCVPEMQETHFLELHAASVLARLEKALAEVPST